MPWQTETQFLWLGAGEWRYPAGPIGVPDPPIIGMSVIRGWRPTPAAGILHPRLRRAWPTPPAGPSRDGGTPVNPRRLSAREPLVIVSSYSKTCYVWRCQG